MATSGFTRKKVGSLVLGEKLKKIRNEYRISLNEVSKHTRIQVKYLEYLESGEYEKLPADVYVRGFVRSYAQFLGTDEKILLKLYEKERSIQKNLKKEHFKEQYTNSFHFPAFIITPKLIFGALISFLVFGSFAYLYSEFQSFAAVPYLTVVEPIDGQTIEGSETYVRGKAEKDAALVINGQPVLVDDEGAFYEQVRLQPGLNTFSVTATNRFKKEKTETVTIQARYDTAEGNRPETNTDEFFNEVKKKKFEISTQENGIKISVEVDGGMVYSGLLEPGSVQSFQVGRELKVSSEDGSHTFVRPEGGEIQPLSEEKGIVKDKIYTP